MKKIIVIGISPALDLITQKAYKVIKEAPVVLTYNINFPFSLRDLLENKKVIMLTFPPRESPDRDKIIKENVEKVKSINEKWGVFLEIGDCCFRNPFFYHILGGEKLFDEVEFIPGVSSVTAVFSRLGIIAKHFCVFGAEEIEAISKLIGICDTFVIVNIHDTRVFDLLRACGYKITFIKNCCNEDEEITEEYKGDTYWIIAVAMLRKNM